MFGDCLYVVLYIMLKVNNCRFTFTFKITLAIRVSEFAELGIAARIML